jgi:hypothetical protein
MRSSRTQLPKDRLRRTLRNVPRRWSCSRMLRRTQFRRLGRSTRTSCMTCPTDRPCRRLRSGLGRRSYPRRRRRREQEATCIGRCRYCTWLPQDTQFRSDRNWWRSFGCPRNSRRRPRRWGIDRRSTAGCTLAARPTSSGRSTACGHRREGSTSDGALGGSRANSGSATSLATRRKGRRRPDAHAVQARAQQRRQERPRSRQIREEAHQHERVQREPQTGRDRGRPQDAQRWPEEPARYTPEQTAEHHAGEHHGAGGA